MQPEFRHGSIDTPAQWARLLAGLVLVFALFHYLGHALGSDRGQAGLVIALLVVGTTLAVERTVFGQGLASALRSLGLGRPKRRGLVVVAAVCTILLLVVLVFSTTSRVATAFLPGWRWLLPGLFAQGGIAEEVLFRGYLFGRLRRGRSFWRATGLSMLPFATVHLLLFATMPWPVALAALLLSIVLSVPLAHLFELGGATIWAPAVLHFVVQTVPKVITFADAGAAALFPLLWMAASALVPMCALFVPRAVVSEESNGFGITP